ncbi:hypothetical protein DTO96_100178 [Ephemeroptericola cinctiostellae]|uniref:Uncharacterized protein n=1 Tax=Ephemeroptericola cinctiostellae TaxID=2268024 RepID=A0A345D7Y2_9BURK|nr:lyase [Ephemeroptericola cinctiostellae]AXF84470.1 hypothetical protein DTO96_100178 [Ephemeroptericola cinctiostellae]
MIAVPDAGSIATMSVLPNLLNRRIGFRRALIYAALQLAQTMREHNEAGSIVNLICNLSERYRKTPLCGMTKKCALRDNV